MKHDMIQEQPPGKRRPLIDDAPHEENLRYWMIALCLGCGPLCILAFSAMAYLDSLSLWSGIAVLSIVPIIGFFLSWKSTRTLADRPAKRLGHSLIRTVLITFGAVFEGILLVLFFTILFAAIEHAKY